MGGWSIVSLQACQHKQVAPTLHYTAQAPPLLPGVVCPLHHFLFSHPTLASFLLLLAPHLAQVAVETPAKLQRYQGGVGQLLAAGGWPDVAHLAACCSPDTRVRRG